MTFASESQLNAWISTLQPQEIKALITSMGLEGEGAEAELRARMARALVMRIEPPQAALGADPDDEPSILDLSRGESVHNSSMMEETFSVATQVNAHDYQALS